MNLNRTFAQFLRILPFLLVCQLCLIFTFSTAKAQNNKTSKVLLLNSYHKGYLWTDEITRGVEETLDGKIDELYVEYLDTKRQFDIEYQNNLTKLLKSKHSKHKYDIIITSDDNAFNYIKNNREEIYGNIPIVFCGLNYYDTARKSANKNITGVVEVADIVGNIDLINSIHPDCNQIVVITDNTTTGKKIQEEVQRIKQSSKPFPKIELLYNISGQELKDTVVKFNPNTVLLYTFFFSDSNHKFYEFNLGAKMVSEHANVPIYGCWDFTMGYGIIGGYLTIGYDQGSTAAKMALEILSGTPVHEISIINTPLTKLQFDYRALVSNEIDFKELPPNHQMLFEPPSFVKTYQKQIISVSVFILLLILFIVILSFILRKTNRVKNELEKNQMLLSSLFQNIPGAVYRCSIDKGWTIKFLNENVVKICGYKPNELIGKNIAAYTNLIHTDDYDRVMNTIDFALQANVSWKMSYRVNHKSGKTIWVKESGRGVKNKEGIYIYADGIIHNVTNEKVAEAKLKESEEKYRQLSQELDMIIDHIPGIVFYKDMENNYLYVNNYLANGHQLDKNEFKNKSLYDIYPKNLASQYHRDDLEVINSKKAKLQYEEKWISHEGEKWLLTSKIPYFDGLGEIKGVIGVGIDISKRKVFELQLKEKNKEYELLNNRLLQGNKKLQKAEIELKEHRDNLEKLVAKRTSEIGELNNQLIDSNSELYATNDLLTKQKEELEDVIEELKITHQQLIQSEKMASIGVLTAGIAHEINNPINFISSGLTGMEMILNDVVSLLKQCRLKEKDYGLSPETINKSIENIPKLITAMRNGVIRTTEIVRSLRTFSRIESENKVKSDIYELIDSTLIILKNKYKNRINIVKDYAPIPHIYCYPSKLSQVILNLMINAMQAIEGEGEIVISTHLDEKNEQLRLVIKDSGSGIPESIADHIFDPFFTTKEVGEGTGLGLSIVHSIIEEHKGTIKCKSVVGEGTEFIIIIPIL